MDFEEITSAATPALEDMDFPDEPQVGEKQDIKVSSHICMLLTMCAQRLALAFPAPRFL